MSIRRECTIEQLQQSADCNFVSVKIKPGEGVSELVLNPNLFPTVNVFLKQIDFPAISKKSLEYTCTRCQGCASKVVSDGKGFRVHREGYWRDEANKPLFVQRHYSAEEKDSTTRKICVVEDDLVQGENMAETFAQHHNTDLFVINTYARAPLTAQRELLAAITRFQPHWVISDKGLGEVDGIELIRGLRQYNIQTIMYTGEIQTGETRRVADFFVEKPFFEQLLEIIEGVN